MTENYLLLHEVILIIAIFIAPPMLASAFMLFAFWLCASRRSSKWHLVLGIGGTALAGTLASVALLVWMPESMRPFIGVRDLILSPVWLPVFPGGFLVFFFVSLLSVGWSRSVMGIENSR